ncbi:MAG: hypothetical protein FWF50_04585 [Defluviitaleaceae bacterium]|nr:hypothetical protein [Defluviitaleaceae bacterium]
MSKRSAIKKLAVSILAGFMVLGTMPLNTLARDRENNQTQELFNFVEFDVFELSPEDLEKDYIVKYENIFFDDYGNKHKTRVTFEPTQEFREYIEERNKDSLITPFVTNRDAFMGRIGSNSVSRSVFTATLFARQTMSFDFDLYTVGTSLNRRVANARHFYFSGSHVDFTNPSLNISRAEPTLQFRAEVNGSVQATSRALVGGTSQTWLLTARVTQSGLIGVYSNF